MRGAHCRAHGEAHGEAHGPFGRVLQGIIAPRGSDRTTASSLSPPLSISQELIVYKNTLAFENHPAVFCLLPPCKSWQRWGALGLFFERPARLLLFFSSWTSTRAGCREAPCLARGISTNDGSLLDGLLFHHSRYTGKEMHVSLAAPNVGLTGRPYVVSDITLKKRRLALAANALIWFSRNK